MEKEKLLADIIQKSAKNMSADITKNDCVLGKIPYKTLVTTHIITQEEYDLIEGTVKDFGLDDPKKLIKWLVDLHFAEIESINEGIVLIRNDLLTNEISKIKSVKYKLSDLNANEDQSHWYKNYADDMSDVLTNLEGKTKNYLNEIISIDSLPRYLYFLKANFNKTKVTSSIKMGKAALEAYFEALIIYSVLANARETKTKVEERFKDSFEFIEKLELSYFIAYDKEKSQFWNKNDMIQKIKDAQELGDKVNDYLIAEQETEINFETDMNWEV